jgi:hypothetical protein
MVVPINPTFINSYNLGRKVWVISDLQVPCRLPADAASGNVCSLGMNFAAVCLMQSWPDWMAYTI